MEREKYKQTDGKRKNKQKDVKSERQIDKRKERKTDRNVEREKNIRV